MRLGCRVGLRFRGGAYGVAGRPDLVADLDLQLADRVADLEREHVRPRVNKEH